MNAIEDEARSIFLAALERTADQWPAFLAEACGDNAELRARVEQLLQAHQVMGSIHGGGPGEPVLTVDEHPVCEAPGTVIGPYKLIQQVGEGGMGTVWMAQQTQPVKRLVAIKLIKAGMDSRQVIARFEAERQALALMDHANIARVLDAGTTSAGRPYFVMDLVKGVPITRYCDEHHLTPRQRLELFIPICQAVQHAHQKGIIHRDIKPSNVLVALYDGKPVPKVIDFGVAKAAGQSLTEKTLVTGFGAIVGTLEYMSPEQAEINQLDIDTRSDIYSLGVLLYELLTGTPPFTRRELQQAGMLEMLRVIREQEPSKPSTKLSTAEGLPTLAANRGTDPAKLTKLVRGELDWIVMKALEKDRNRRYETANGFAMDVQRYLADEPVQACPPSVGYRAGKFVRRHKMALGTAALVSASLLLAVVVLAVSNVRIQEESQARAAEKEAKEDALADKLRAEQKRREEEEKKKEEAEGRARANEGWRQTAYYQKTARILTECQRSNLTLAEELLEECPKDLRRWEWDYLKRLCHAEVRRVPLDGLTEWRVAALAPGATHLVSVAGSPGKFVLRVHDLATGKETLTRPLTGYVMVQGVRYSPDGKRLAVCGLGVQEGPREREKVPEARPSSDPIWDWLREGKEGGGLLRVLDAATGEERLVAKGPPAKEGWGAFWGVAFRPRGSRVVVSDMRGHMMAFDQETGKEVWRVDAYPITPAPHPNRVWYTSMAYSPDGAQLITECSGGEFKVWDAEKGKFQRTVKGGGKGSPWTFFSPRGTWLVTVGPDPVVRLCDPETGEPRQFFRGNLSPITAVAIRPDEKRLAMGTEDGSVRIWDLVANRQIGAYRSSTGSVHRMTFNAAGDQLATFNINSAPVVRFWDATRGPEARVFAAGGAYRAVLSPDGRRVAAAAVVAEEMRPYVFVWDAQTGQELLRLGEKSELPFAVAFSPDGAFVAAALTTTQDQGMVKVWDARTGKLIRTLSDPRVAMEAARPAVYGVGAVVPISPGGPLGTLAPGQTALHVLKGQWVRPGAPCDVVTWSPDGRRIASGAQDRAVRVWDAATGRQLWASKSFLDDGEGGHNRTISGLAFSRDGRRLASATGGIERRSANEGSWAPDTDHDRPDVKVWDVATGQELQSLTLPGKTEALALSPDGQTIAVGFGRSWTDMKKRICPPDMTMRPVVEVFSSPVGDKSVRLYSVATGAEVGRLRGHARPTTGIAFSPDGLRLVTAGGSDDTLKLWDPRSGEEILTFGYHRGIVTSVAFGADGKKIVSTSLQDVRVWDATPLER